MLGQQEPGIWASRATDVRSPLSRSPWCAGLKQSPFFPTSLCAQELNSPHFTAAEVEAQESRPHGLHSFIASGSSGQAKHFYADKRAEAGPWLAGLGFLCLVLLNGLCRETAETARTGGGPGTYPSAVGSKVPGPMAAAGVFGTARPHFPEELS